VKILSVNHMFPLIVGIELPGKRSADYYGGNDAKSKGTEQAPSRRGPVIRNPVTLMNGSAGVRVNRRFHCGDANGEMKFFVIM
jgi:hypothetical protein